MPTMTVRPPKADAMLAMAAPVIRISCCQPSRNLGEDAVVAEQFGPRPMTKPSMASRPFQFQRKGNKPKREVGISHEGSKMLQHCNRS